MAKPGIRVEGLRELSRSFKQLGGPALQVQLRQANKNSAAAVAVKAKPMVPVGATGNLQRSVRPLASQRSGTVVAGSKKVPYAKAIHWGTGPRSGRRGPHNIKGKPFLYTALMLSQADIANTYRHELSVLIRKVAWPRVQ